jgi:hypothetical protein
MCNIISEVLQRGNMKEFTVQTNCMKNYIIRMGGGCSLETINTYRSSIQSVRVIVDSQNLKSKPSKVVIVPNDLM